MRVLLLDPQSRVLLFEGRDLSDPADAQRWWFTAGGGIDHGESVIQAARRELEEETGLREVQLVDLAHRREFDYLNHGEPQHQIEHFFAARSTRASLATDGWTDLEQRAVTAWRWWSADELDTTTVTFYPDNLPTLVRRASELV